MTALRTFAMEVTCHIINTQPEFLANLGELCVNLVIISDFCISISYYDELPRGRDEQG